jgi:hypothetical protein
MNKNINLPYIDVFLFIIFVLFANFIYCYLYITKFPLVVDENYKYVLSNLGFNYSEMMENLLKNNSLEATYFETTFHVSRMPLIPLTLKFLYLFISENFFIIHLVKNLFFSLIIFFLLKQIFITKPFFYLALILLFINPHNLWVSFSFNFEEGLLNFLLIILVLLIISKIKTKILFISVLLFFMYFLKSSMFFLCFAVAIYYLLIFIKKREIFHLLPLVFLLIGQIIWGVYSYDKTGFFAFGTKSVSFNSFTLNHAYNDEFIKIYPSTSPDILTEKLEKSLPSSVKKDEWSINEYYFKKSINYLRDNPYNIFVGFLKKLQVVFLYPYKDSQIPDENGIVNNEIRFSGIINKLFFILSMFVLVSNLIKSNKNDANKRLNIVFLIILFFYFFPYMVGFIYSRHCTGAYMISYIFLAYSIQENFNKLSFVNKKINDIYSRYF